QVKALPLAQPKTVPAGIYAREYLTKLGLWTAIARKVVPTDNVRAALDAVESGNVDAGIVYKTDARISKQVKVAYEVPRAEGPRISYPFAVVAATKHSASARRFLRFLGSPAARKVFEKHGFLVQAPR
ncbi:MAG TPA: molybdate ABC transporter substrate-binding protein, partial [Thermoanaerobaculia bacterium]|nr:molybdate ABC transporter substrate-binding protein [Thermoanaerobaculia bacterium]